MNLHAVPSSWLLINQTLEDQCLNNWASIGRVVFPAHREQGPDAQKPVFLRSRTASADGSSQSFQPLLRGGGERIQTVPQRFVAKTYSWELSFDLSRAFSASLWGQTPSTPYPPPPSFRPAPNPLQCEAYSPHSSWLDPGASAWTSLQYNIIVFDNIAVTKSFVLLWVFCLFVCLFLVFLGPHLRIWKFPG